MNERYFVSYEHTDKEKTEAILRFLKSCGLSIWYDGDIRLYHDWTDEIRTALQETTGLILIATNDTVRRPVVIKEVETMLQQNKPVYVICLENIRINGLQEPVRTLIIYQQYVLLRRYNTAALRSIVQSIQSGKPLQNTDAMSLSDYINTNSDPRPVYAAGKLQYYRIELADILPYSGTILELDDQWYPPEIYAGGQLYSQDLTVRRKIQAMRTPLQWQEFLRGLLHSRQILVNRAFFQNSPVFRSVYEDTNAAQKEALRQMLNQGALVLVLMDEDPYQDTEYQSDKESWGTFLRTCQPYFMKFDWDSPEFNRQINRTTLFEPFGTAMMTLFAHSYTAEEWIRRYGIEDREGFLQLLETISSTAMDGYRKNRRYNRTQLYRDFVTVDESALPLGSPFKGVTVRDTIMDPNKPFAPVIKQIADEIYAMNFAYSHVCDLKSGNMYLQKTDGTEAQYSRVLYADELTGFLDALVTQVPKVFQNVHTIPAVSLASLQLDTILSLRSTIEWEEYITAVEFLKKRTYRWSLDDEGMVKAVQAYLRILDKLPQQNEQMPFAFSVLFRLSSFVITMTIRYNSEINDFEYVYTTEGTPSKEASIVHISFEVRDRLNDNAIASPEANILICTGITNRSCEPYAKELLAYLEDPQNPFRHV